MLRLTLQRPMTSMMSQGFYAARIDGPEPAKLSQLRAKTDQQLQDLIQSKLEAGLRFAVLAREHTSSDPVYAGQLLASAGQAVAEVEKLLPVLNEARRRVLVPRFNQLREALPPRATAKMVA